jgi:hypothetical protein
VGTAESARAEEDVSEMEQMMCRDALVAQWQSSGLLNRSVQVQVLPGALEQARALVAQRQSSRLLSGGLQVRVLPGASMYEESERAMERLISLFREPDYESPPQLNEQTPPRADEEPVYFRQLLEYLRQRKERASEESDELIGV